MSTGAAHSSVSWEGIESAPQLREILAQVGQAAPLIHFLSSSVAMPFVADALLAAGARPMMTASPADAPAMCTHADAVVVNLATLTDEAAAAIEACRPALTTQPWILDPAAIGAPPRRTSLARELLTQGPSIVRANASEVLALAGGKGGRGADTTAPVSEAVQLAEELSRTHHTVLAVSGPSDLIVDGSQRVLLSRGVPQLTQVTGTGCLLGALIAACRSVTTHNLLAALAGSAWLALAGEIAAARTCGCGSFKVALIDALEEVRTR